jgi:hypothetical protein
VTEPHDVLSGRAEIERAFTALGERLARRGVVADVFVVGGAAMALAYDAARVTRDVDAVFMPHGIVLEEARRVADDLGLPLSLAHSASATCEATGCGSEVAPLSLDKATYAQRSAGTAAGTAVRHFRAHLRPPLQRCAIRGTATIPINAFPRCWLSSAGRCGGKMPVAGNWVSTSVTSASIVCWPVASATETRWWPSLTK